MSFILNHTNENMVFISLFNGLCREINYPSKTIKIESPIAKQYRGDPVNRCNSKPWHNGDKLQQEA